MTMRDVDYGKKIAEEMTMESFLDAFPRVTGRSIEITDQGETPDFVALVDGRQTGIELTEIRAGSPEDYVDEVGRLSLKKETTFEKMGGFTRPTILLCYG